MLVFRKKAHKLTEEERKGTQQLLGMLNKKVYCNFFLSHFAIPLFDYRNPPLDTSEVLQSKETSAELLARTAVTGPTESKGGARLFRRLYDFSKSDQYEQVMSMKCMNPS